MATTEQFPSKDGASFNRYIYIPGVSPEADKALIGAKALHLTELQNAGLPVPPFIVLTTNGWKDEYLDEQSSQNHELPSVLQEQLANGLPYLEGKAKKRFGDKENPLFVSVRSGSSVSMPGAMHTILNVGITETNIHALEKRIGRENAQYAYFTLIRSLGTHAFGIEDNIFRNIRDDLVGHDPLIKPSPKQYTELVHAAKAVYVAQGSEFPEDAWDQLRIAADSVYRSWNFPEARDVRLALHIPDDLGTAVTIQEMVWGNSNKRGAGSGVMFTRDPTTGIEDPIAVFAKRGQGPKVVGDKAKQLDTSLSQVPFQFRLALTGVIQRLSVLYPRPQEVEFTIDGNRLWLLQTRPMPMSTVGEFRFLMDQIHHKSITMEDAKKRLSLEQLHRLLVPELEPQDLVSARKAGRCLGTGVSLSPGWAKGHLVTSIEQAKRNVNTSVILYADLSPKDLRELPDNVRGVISQTGSIGSHKARAATKLDAQGIVAIFGVHLDGFKKGRVVTISGSTNEVFLGKIRTSSTSTILLEQSERNIIKQWVHERSKNPWLFISQENGIDQLTKELNQAITEARRNFLSPKAHAIIAINAMIPPEIRIPYTVISKTDEVLVRKYLRQALNSGSDVTIRTCRYPDTRGTSPYAVITNKADEEHFFQDPNYTNRHGGWHRWLDDSSITEVVVGEIPKNKLNPKFYQYHCNWTLSCVGEHLYLQIVPGNPFLRSQETMLPERMITVEMKHDSSCPNGIRLQRLVVGSELKTNTDRYTFLNVVARTVLGTWWKDHNLALRMAAVSEVMPQFLVPGLEGQASIFPGNEWVKVYGVKADEGDAE